MESFPLRDIAHELRQPLSTIEAIAYYLTLVLPRDDQKTHEQLDRLQQLVEQSNWILSNGVHLSDCPAPAPEGIDVEELITQTLATHPSPTVRLELCGTLPQIQADPGLACALIENLLTLFRQVSTAEHPATVRTSADGSGVRIEMVTRAPGFRSPAMLGPGALLSVASARRIVEAHAGRFELGVDAASGIRLEVVLP